MTDVNINPYSLNIPTVHVRREKSIVDIELFLKFDSQWPIQLNGIISEDEFRKSIDKINDAFVPIQRHPKYDLGICLFLTVLGVICAIVGGIKQINGLTSVGSVLAILSPICFLIIRRIIDSQRTKRLRRVIAKESAKYSSRSPRPCSWRLNVTLTGEPDGSSKPIYHLVIDIGRPAATRSENGVHHSTLAIPEPIAFVERQDNDVPPPYSSQLASFCSRCGAPRQDLTAEFCLSCRQSFNKLACPSVTVLRF